MKEGKGLLSYFYTSNKIYKGMKNLHLLKVGTKHT